MSPLCQEFLHGAIAITLVTLVGEGLGKADGETEAGIYLAQEQRDAITGEAVAGEIDQDLAVAKVSKEQLFSRTACRARGGITNVFD